MFLTIGNVLDGGAVGHACSIVAQLEWRDGAHTAGDIAKRVKRNEQADLSKGAGKTLAGELVAAISRNDILKAAARPARFSPLLISRTGIGGGYGPHVDNAIMGTGECKLRTDLSFTLFLSAPESYEGGGLALDLPGGTQILKPSAGDLVLYPSTLIHEVAPVTAGERLVVVGWIQSEIRSGEQRQILFDLEQVRTTLRAKPDAGPERLMLDKVFSNLLRQWSGQ